jgi:peptide/nickel transport system substrate-binding protein
VRTVTTGNRPEGIALDGNAMYVAVRTSGVAHRGGTLTVVSHAPFDSIDPAVSYGPPSWSAMTLTNDGLVTFNRVGGSDGARIVPDLATSIPVPTDGGRTYTFQLRPAIHYSTGASVRPADFRRAIERSLATPSGTGFFLNDLVGAGACVEAPKRCDLSRGIVPDSASNTVTFHLTAPEPDFLYRLALTSSYAVPAATPLRTKLPLPATGPYMIKSYDAKHGVLLVRNPQFREWSPEAQPDGYPDQIVFKFGVSPNVGIREVREGKADYTFDAAGSVSALRRDGYGSQLHLNPTLDTLYFFLNTTLAPFNDIRVRRAVNYAVDRNRLIKQFRNVFPLQPTCTVLPPNFAGYRHDCPYPLDLAKAHGLVAASGTKGQKITVWVGPFIAIHGGPYFVSVLRSLGYKVRLKVIKPGTSYYPTVGDSREKAQTGGAGWSADYPSSSDFFDPQLTCASFHPDSKTNPNFAAFCNHSIDAEIARARILQTSDPQAAAVLWSKVDHDVIDQAPWVVYATDQTVDFVSHRVRNYVHNPQWGALLDQMWVR